MFYGIFQLISNLIEEFFGWLIPLFVSTMENLGITLEFFEKPVNLYLFSDNLIFSAAVYELFTFILVVIAYIFVIKFLFKATKKFINMVFGVFKL